MPRLRGKAHIHTSRTIRGFRSCRHFTGISLTHFESGRIGFEKEKTAVRGTLNRRHGRRHIAGSRLLSEDVPVHDWKTLNGVKNNQEKKGTRYEN